jgi:hypothetical protein
VLKWLDVRWNSIEAFFSMCDSLRIPIRELVVRRSLIAKIVEHFEANAEFPLTLPFPASSTSAASGPLIPTRPLTTDRRSKLVAALPDDRPEVFTISEAHARRDSGAAKTALSSGSRTRRA